MVLWLPRVDDPENPEHAKERIDGKVAEPNWEATRGSSGRRERGSGKHIRNVTADGKLARVCDDGCLVPSGQGQAALTKIESGTAPA